MKRIKYLSTAAAALVLLLEDIDKALAVAGIIQGVKSVKNDMRVK